MKNIAIITGGDSKEYEISLMSANTVYNNLDKEKFTPYIIEIRDNIWKIKIENSYKIIEKEHLTLEINNTKIKFKDVFMSLHGPPAENGELQILLERQKINYTCCNPEVSALTFNKYRCNQKLKKLGHYIAESYLYTKEEKLKIDYFKVSRNPTRNSELSYTDLSGKLLKEYSIIINTSPLGTYPNINEKPMIPYQFLTPKHLLYDLIYNPVETAFLIEGKKRGTQVKNGLEMLELQAEESWRIWNK